MSSAGYTVEQRGEVVATFWCRVCVKKTCGCFSLAREHLHTLTGGRVFGEFDGRRAELAWFKIAGGVEESKEREQRRALAGGYAKSKAGWRRGPR